MNSKFLKSALCLTVLGVLNSHVFSMEDQKKILPEENINNIDLQNSNINNQVLQNPNMNIEYNRDNKKDNVKYFENIDMGKINNGEARELVDSIGSEISHKKGIPSYNALLNLEEYTEKMQNKFNEIKEEYNLKHHSEVIDDLDKYSKSPVSDLGCNAMLMEYDRYNFVGNILSSLIKQYKVGKDKITDEKSDIGLLYLNFWDLKYTMLSIQNKIENLGWRNELLRKEIEDCEKLIKDFCENEKCIVEGYSVRMEADYNSLLQQIKRSYMEKENEYSTRWKDSLESFDNKDVAKDDKRNIIYNARDIKRINDIYKGDIEKLKMEHEEQLNELKTKYNDGNFDEKALERYNDELKAIKYDSEVTKQKCSEKLQDNNNELNKLQSDLGIKAECFNEFMSRIEQFVYINGLFKFFTLREEIKFYINGEESQFASTMKRLKQFIESHKLMNKDFNLNEVSVMFGNKGKNSSNKKSGELNVINNKVNNSTKVFSDKRINNNNFSSNKGSALYSNVNYQGKIVSQSGSQYVPSNMGNSYGNNKGLQEIKEDRKESSQKVQMDNYNQDEEKKQENNKEINQQQYEGEENYEEEINQQQYEGEENYEEEINQQQYEGEEEMIDMNYNEEEINQQSGEGNQGEEGFGGTNQNINNQKK